MRRWVPSEDGPYGKRCEVMRTNHVPGSVASEESASCPGDNLATAVPQPKASDSESEPSDDTLTSSAEPLFDSADASSA